MWPFGLTPPRVRDERTRPILAISQVGLFWLLHSVRLSAGPGRHAARTASSTPRENPNGCLMLHSFGRDFGRERIRPENQGGAERDRNGAGDSGAHAADARFNDPGPETPFVDYLRSLYTDRPPDIV